MNSNNPISDALEALRDKDTRAKALAAILGAFGVGAIMAAWCLHGMMTSKGCSASIGFESAFGAGMLALMILAIIWFAGGYILYGSFHLPGFIREKLEDRKQPWYQEQKRLERENRDPLSVRIGKHFSEYWKTWAAVIVFIGGVVLLAYTLAYLAWLLFC